MNTVKIYCLICPLTLEVKYVGQTSREVKSRVYAHINEGKLNPKNAWLSELEQQGKEPFAAILESTTEELGNSVELKWIHTFKANGFTLFNNETFVPRPIKPAIEKVEISSETYKAWRSLTRYGDLSAIAALLNIPVNKVKSIMEFKRGTAEEIEVINNYFNQKTNRINSQTA